MSRLRYVSTDEPGYSRKPWGQGFTYRDQDGQTVNDPDLREWFESIVIPPAWTDVWISPYKNGHILATGRDDKGRKQYIYHPDWGKVRDQKKFDQLYEFGQSLPKIREVTDQHLRHRNVTRDRVLAALVRLLEMTLIRVGNDEYAKKNDSYGLTTLTDDHAEIDGGTVTFDFVGKSGKEHSIVLKDRRLARVVKRCQDIPGYELFQYYDENGEHRVVDSADVNDYLHEITGKSFTAKVFRTWGGSTLAIQYLCEQCDETESESATRACVSHVADMLGNTKAVSRQYYIHPIIMDAHLDGTLDQIYAQQQKKKPRSDYDLTPEERTLMMLIEQRMS